LNSKAEPVISYLLDVRVLIDNVNACPEVIAIVASNRRILEMDNADQNSKTDKEISAEFTSYYLQRATKEFAEDLDKVRTASDFKNDALPLLVHALQQGTAIFSPRDQRKIVEAGTESSQTEEKQ
jgi:ribosome assembly protein 3